MHRRTVGLLLLCLSLAPVVRAWPGLSSPWVETTAHAATTVAEGTTWPADRLFDLAKKPKQTVVLTIAEDSPSDGLMKQPAAGKRAGGVLAELDAKQIAELCNLTASRPPSEKNTAAGNRMCVVHMAGPAGSRRVAIEQYPDGAYVAVELTDAAGTPVRSESLRREALRPELVDRFLGNIGYLGPLNAAAGESGKLDEATKQAVGEVFEVDKPYQNGSLLLDGGTLGERLGFGGAVKYDATTRVLTKEKFWARLPPGYSAAKPAALLVWVDAAPSGRPPRAFFEGLDQCGAVCIGAAESGNQRPVTERLQLALDAINTAKRRWNIDPARVYVTGISGGGKMAGLLLMLAPEVFTGAVSIVGLSFYESIPTGKPRETWPSEFAKPTGKRWDLLLKRRLAVVTGGRDFNHAPILAGVKLYQRDKLNVRLFDVANMGHELPTSQAFAEQLDWVDQGNRAASEK